MKRLTWILASAILLTNSGWCASALTALGYGLPSTSANARAGGMGMISLAAPDSLGVSYLHPAAWGGNEATRFCFSGGYANLSLKDPSGSDANDEAGLNGVAFVVPVGRGKLLGLTISPYTRMDYKWTVEDSVDWAATRVLQQGTGGFSQGMLGLSLPLHTGMRLGLALRPLFGKVDRHWRETYQGVEANSSGESISDRFNGFGWGLSWQWQNPGFWSLGMSILGPVKVNVTRQTVILAAGYSVYDDKGKLGEKYELPWDITLGAAQWFGRHIAAGEIQYQGWGGVDRPKRLADRFMDAWRFSLGWEWAPEYRLLDPFWRSLTYRSGVYLQDNYTRSLAGHRARRIALTGGLSIPCYGGRSRIDLAFEIGWMGDETLDGIAERTVGFSIGFNHSEEWFIGRREKK